MSLEIDYKLFESLEKLILYQNIILLKRIASDKYWDFQDLKKFIPQAMAKTLLKSQNSVLEEENNSKSKSKPNFKIIKKKIIKKKIKKKVTNTESVDKKKKIIKKKVLKKTDEVAQTT